MTERERILDEMSTEIEQSLRLLTEITPATIQRASHQAAEIALRVIEAPLAGTEDYSRICTCGQNGFKENSVNSNHPHTKSCPQYTGYAE